MKAKLNVTPVLLLDDIFDKLDQTRVERLMKLVHDQFFGQVLVTDTDEDRIREIFAKNDLESKMLKVGDCKVVEVRVQDDCFISRFGDEWEAYLAGAEMKKISDLAETRIKKSGLFAKGKGKGKEGPSKE